MDWVSDLGLDSWGGIVSFVASAGLAITPFLWKSSRKRKKKAEKLGVAKVVDNYKNWLDGEGKILKFGFAKSPVLVSRKMSKNAASLGVNPLVAIVEFKGKEVPLFVGDENYSEGAIVLFKYNPLDYNEIILAD